MGSNLKIIELRTILGNKEYIQDQHDQDSLDPVPA